jgi:imidazolonepropionase-like amidohydrolase
MNIHNRISFSTLCMSLVFIFRAIDLSAAEEDRRTVALTGARLLDGTGHDPVENTVLVIEGDRISAVGAAGSVKYPDDAQVIDCHGQTIIPGLISDHSHLGLVDLTSIKPENYNRENITN